MEKILILGSGLAGYSLAREIRAVDESIELQMITADAGDFYSKPMLSNGLAQGKQSQDLVNATAESMSDKLKMRIDTNCRVTAIDTERQQVITDRGEHRYTSLVLALGAKPIIPVMRGDAEQHRVTVNSLYDYHRFRQLLPQSPAHVAIIGPGLIGCEFANDLLSQGYQVSLIGPDPHPISTLLPAITGKALQQAMTETGTHWHLQQTAAIMDQLAQGYRLTLTDASIIDCDLVLSAVGLLPEMQLATEAGLGTARGIVTDRMLRTSNERIYALGDCAEIAGFNLPYVMPIMNAARALAKTLTGEPTEVVYPAMPVVIKTPLHPIVIAPPQRGAAGDWQNHQDQQGTECLFHDPEGQLSGFVLSGKYVERKQSLTKQLPHLLPATG
ncbi:MAG: FAD-dependent oxidoreductase [Candidatus Thiodiazotropha lotti]|nr:FAD-dependent oxidoreductase [Candidatus Thiodiazotropha lotti]MCG7999636.1 FAD-dependent oxidoreductase [Candidatus Thiodiazotropha lotti]MCW4183267.1 FAD-dependent oxidoreductase [Candidatus Thiodiazotropha weberae]MCW4191404.1 FAD-dependent oxidoreductase [Candidatus Thiodiazotropha weberae]